MTSTFKPQAMRRLKLIYDPYLNACGLHDDTRQVCDEESCKQVCAGGSEATTQIIQSEDTTITTSHYICSRHLRWCSSCALYRLVGFERT